MATSKKIRILVADDTPVARRGFEKMLEGEKDFKIVGYASKVAQETLRMASEQSPDVIIMDLVWSGDETSGWTVIRELKKLNPEIRIIAVTAYSDNLIREARNAGADLAIRKDFHEEDLFTAIRELVASKANFETDTNEKILTPKEQEVLKLVATGEPDKKIAILLMISENTVKSHVKNIFSKLKVDNRISAINRAKDLRII